MTSESSHFRKTFSFKKLLKEQAFSESSPASISSSMYSSFIQHEISSLEKKKPKNRRIFVEAHRGGMGLAPENTMRAFRKCIELGVDSVEFDVWNSKDEVPVVIHGKEDGNMVKTTGFDGFVGDYNVDFLKTLDAGEGEKIPTLEEVLILFKPTPIFLNIEVKGTQNKLIPSILLLLQKHDFLTQCCLSSFNHVFLEQAARIQPHAMEFGYLYNHADEDEVPPNEVLFSKGHTINLRSTRVTKEVVNDAHKNHFGVHVWFPQPQLETEEAYRHLVALGVDIICVNYPDILLKILDELN